MHHTLRAWLCFSAFAASSSVLPVVVTSSISSTTLPPKSSPGWTIKQPLTFAMRLSFFKSFCVLVGRVRTRMSPYVSASVSARVFAKISDWLYPRQRFRLVWRGREVTTTCSLFRMLNSPSKWCAMSAPYTLNTEGIKLYLPAIMLSEQPGLLYCIKHRVRSGVKVFLQGTWVSPNGLGFVQTMHRCCSTRSMRARQFVHIGSFHSFVHTTHRTGSIVFRTKLYISVITGCILRVAELWITNRELSKSPPGGGLLSKSTLGLLCGFLIALFQSWQRRW